MSIQPAIDYIDKDGFRANVGIVLTRGSGEVFLGGRVGGRGWQFPQGGVNRGERVEEAFGQKVLVGFSGADFDQAAEGGIAEVAVDPLGAGLGLERDMSPGADSFGERLG